MKGRYTFTGGTHPFTHIHEGKSLAKDMPVEVMPPPAVVKIPMAQHIGAPAKAVVSPGDDVVIGQVIGEAGGFVSANIHASISGKVTDVKPIMGINGKPVNAVIIENDFEDRSERLYELDPEDLSPEEIIERIKQAGIVGMGGATFPTHVKLSPPPGKTIDTLIINGAECEPFLTADDRLMRENAFEIVQGIKIVMRALGVKKAAVGIEDNKPEAIKAMREAIDTDGISVAVVKTKYPQGSEKQLIQAITGRVVPSGGLPADVGAVDSNVATTKAIADAFYEGKSLIGRIMTVTGAVKTPKNLFVRIGTALQDVLRYVGGATGEPLKIISGGPMMGLPVPSMECVVTKGSSGLLVLDKQYTRMEKELNCIQCGKCSYACPIRLMPMVLIGAAVKEDIERAEEYNALDCINCGNCSFVCPAKKPISQSIQFIKEQIMLDRIKQKQKEEN